MPESTAIDFTEILIPTDFSPCALAALRFAIKWNEVNPVRVHVYHKVAGMPTQWNNMSEGEQHAHEGVIGAIRDMHDKFNGYKTVLNDRSVPFKLVYSGGDLAENIAEYIELEKIDFVFMGSHGKLSKEYNKLGSNAVQVVKKVDIPVLITKDTPRAGSIDKVVFASGFDVVSARAFDLLLDMMEDFSPQLHLLNIDKPAVFRQPKSITLDAMRDFQTKAAAFDTVIHFYTKTNIGRGILEFCEKLDVDLIAISESGASIFGSKRIAKPVKYLIEHARQPVLFVQPGETGVVDEKLEP